MYSLVEAIFLELACHPEQNVGAVHDREYDVTLLSSVQPTSRPPPGVDDRFVSFLSSFISPREGDTR